MSGSDNGNATYSLLEESQALLGGRTVLDYYRQRMPSPTDEHIEQLLERGMALPPAERDRWMARLTPELRSLFGIYSHRAASLAIREESADRLRSGLMAAVVANFVIPEKRNVDPLLALLHHVATELEIDPGPLFTEAAGIASEEFAEHLRDFAGKHDLVLSRYGWREIRTPDGIQYKFDWR